MRLAGEEGLEAGVRRVELDREAHQPADILVNGKVVARAPTRSAKAAAVASFRS